MIKAFQGASDETVHDALEALAGFGDAAVPELIDVLKFELRSAVCGCAPRPAGRRGEAGRRR